MKYTLLRVSISSVLGLAFTACDGGPPLITLHTANAELVEYQDGDGPWQVATRQDGDYTFPVASGQYGVLVACKTLVANTGSAQASVTIDHYAVSDGADHVVSGCGSVTPLDLVTVGGHITGNDGALVGVDTGLLGQSLPNAASWTSTALAGNGLVLATRLTEDQLPIGVVLQPVTYNRDQPIDLDFTHELALSEHAIALDPAAGQAIVSGYAAPSGQTYTITQVSPPATFYTLPDAARGDGLSVIDAAAIDVDTLRSVERSFRTPPARLDLPAKLVLATPPTLTTTGAYPTISTVVPAYADVLAYQLSYLGESALWSVTYSSAWLAERGQAGASFTSELPEVPALAAYALPPHDLVWTVSALTGPHAWLPGIDTPEAELRNDGDSFTISRQTGGL